MGGIGGSTGCASGAPGAVRRRARAGHEPEAWAAIVVVGGALSRVGAWPGCSLGGKERVVVASEQFLGRFEHTGGRAAPSGVRGRSSRLNGALES